MTKKPRVSRSLTARFMLFLSLSAIPLGLVILFSAWQAGDESGRRVVADLRQSLDAQQTRLELNLQSAEAHMASLALVAARKALAPDRTLPQGSGQAQSLDHLAPVAEARGLGNYFTSTVRSTDHDTALDAAIAEGLFPLMDSLVRTHPHIAQTYYMAADRGATSIVPFMSGTALKEATHAGSIDAALAVVFDAGGTYPIRMAGPEQNPERRTVWSSAYMDPSGKGLMVSVFAPVWINDRFQGITGCDITLESLNSMLEGDSGKGPITTILVDQAGTVLADSQGRMENRNGLVHIKTLAPDINLPKGLSYQTDTLARRNGLSMLAKTVDRTGWTILAMTRDSDITAARGTGPGAASLVGAIALLTFITVSAFLALHISLPAARLAAFVHETLDNPETPQPRVPAVWRDTFGQIGTMARERCMAMDQLKVERVNLERMVRDRTRELSEKNRELKQSLDELSSTREELHRAEHLAALGRLVAGLSHELNTPIGNSLTLSSNLVRQQSDLRDQVGSSQITQKGLAEHLERSLETARVIESETRRAANLVGYFKQVALDQSSMLRTSFKLGDALAVAVEPWQHRFDHGPWNLKIDADRDMVLDSFADALVEVISILLGNAIHHGLEESREGIVSIRTEAGRPGGFRLIFADSGRGIPPSLRDRVFEPFHTTRRDGNHVGLGLHIARNVVESILGGSIRLDTLATQGCTWILEIPFTAPSMTERGVLNG